MNLSMETPHSAPIVFSQITREAPSNTAIFKLRPLELILSAGIYKSAQRPLPLVRQQIANLHSSLAVATGVLPVTHAQNVILATRVVPERPVRDSVVPESVVLDKIVSYPLPHHSKERNDLAISGWLLLRPSAVSSNIATLGQLGGSQVGTKITSKLASFGTAVQLNGFARGSIALSPIGSGEAAIGMSLRHTGALVSEIQVERRVKLSAGGRNDFAVVASTSLYSLPLTPRTTLTGYAQAGIVGVKARDLFIDGSAKLDRRLRTTDRSEVSVGVDVWAAAQPHIHRIDIGPHLSVKQHLGKGAITISGEWRFRLAGNATPTSGPAISAGFDF